MALVWECEGPYCHKTAPAEQSPFKLTNYPDGWIAIQVPHADIAVLCSWMCVAAYADVKAPV